MSFRLFVWYCMVGGAWSGFIGWALGALLSPESGETYFRVVLRDSVAGMLLGVSVAFGLSLLDAIFNYSIGQIGKVLSRVIVAVFIGLFGGLIGSFIGSSIFFAVKEVTGAGIVSSFSFVIGWTIVGALTGFSISVFELLRSLVMRKDFGGAIKKLRNCFLGGTVGGILGGTLAFVLGAIARMLVQKDNLWTPTALGFIAIGACIGLLVGLAQIILKEAWIKVEAGFRPGRELLLLKEKTSIGRGEGSDIALFGDSGVEKTHANILLESGRYYLEDLQTPGGTYVNDQRVQGKAPLKAGDLIRVGKSVLKFNERAKRKD